MMTLRYVKKNLLKLLMLKMSLSMRNMPVCVITCYFLIFLHFSERSAVDRKLYSAKDKYSIVRLKRIDTSQSQRLVKREKQARIIH